ncbi:MAG: penicillin-binding protein 2 [Legionellales bacterium]|nr:penicillin-binding protein 2 [Legionellales bacterium]
MSKSGSATHYRWRYFFVIFIVLLALGAVVARVAYLSVYRRQFLLSQGDARTLRTIAIPALRGMITDRNGYPLAVSVPVESVWIDPKQFSPTPEALIQIANLLELNLADLKSDLKQNSEREFLYLKRRIDPWLAKKVQGLKIPGLYLRSEFRRYYPEGQVDAHVLGFTNVDDQGQEGLELAFNSWLEGIPGKKRVLKDRYGNIVGDVENIRDPRPGHPLVLAIDRRIQYLAYKALQNCVEEYNAVAGSVVVLNTKTGEILAMVNQPSFNPNSDITNVTSAFRNRAVTDVFEPGSTMKAFSIASALDSGKYTPDSKIDTGKGWIVIGRHTINDDYHNLGVIDVRTVMKKSSNVGVAKMTLSLPPEQLWNLLHRFGFGQRTRSGFPGERSGSLVNHRVWRPISLATLAFGYGVSVTTLQLAHAYSVIANGGIKIPVTFLRVDKAPQGERVLNAKISAEVLSMLEGVVNGKDGTGSLAQIPGYHVAGKTGTARLAGPGGYMKGHYMASFVGIAPATNPQLIVAVVIRDPHKKGFYFGGQIAAPTFSKIMAGALRILDIPPDNDNTVNEVKP